MKFLFLSLFISFGAFAQVDQTIDDLGVISLNLETHSAPTLMLSYPGLGLEDGEVDCLILDITNSRKITIAQKMELAKKLQIRDGFILNNGELPPLLSPRLKDNSKVVFNLVSGGGYLTHLQASGKKGKTLIETIVSVSGLNDRHQVNLVYVRGCRF